MKRIKIAIFVLAFGLSLVACVPNQRIMNSSVEEPKPEGVEPARSDFDQDVESMRTADFRFIYVFRRKDATPIDADDKSFASQNIPVEMNRRTLSDSERAIIVGSNFRMPDENQKILTERFAFEDLSNKP